MFAIEMSQKSPASNHPHAITRVIETGVMSLSQHTSRYSGASLYN